MCRQRIKILLLSGIIALLPFALSGCASSIGSSEPWHLPDKTKSQNGIIIGHFETSVKGEHLLLGNVFVLRPNHIYGGFAGMGEETIVIDNNFFVTPNVEPGEYFIMGYNAGGVMHSIEQSTQVFTVKPGEIKFVGSFLVEDHEAKGLFQQKTFSIKPTNTPSELQALEWLNAISDDTDWEPAIKKRIKELGGNPLTKLGPDLKPIKPIKP